MSPVTRRADDQVDLLGGDPGGGERHPRRLDGEVRRDGPLVGEVPGLDPGPLPDPLVGRVHVRLEPRVRDEARGERRADAGDGGVPGHGPEDIGPQRLGLESRSARRVAAASGEPTAERSRRVRSASSSFVRTSPAPASRKVVGAGRREGPDAGLPPHRRDHLALERAPGARRRRSRARP